MFYDGGLEVNSQILYCANTGLKKHLIWIKGVFYGQNKQMRNILCNMPLVRLR